MPAPKVLSERDLRVLADQSARQVRAAATQEGPVLASFSKTAMPKNPVPGQTVFVPDAQGGAELAFWDGTTWKMTTAVNLN
jgi:hypothetical protein